MARGLNPRNARRWQNAHFGVAGVGNRARLTLGTGNSAYQLWAKVPGTSGNGISFTIAVAGADTPASVSVVGNAITFNAATDGDSAATSTVNEMIRVVGSNPTARGLVHLTRAPGSDGTGVVAAVEETNLTGAV